jgi:4'-phosphopantetheinyl transferase
LNISAAQIDLETNAFGKPFVPGSALRFNFSNSRNRAVLAITWDREIGVDIEQTRQSNDLAELACFCFAPQEYSAFLCTPRAQRPGAFYHYWTWKEAYIKARGEGMSIPLDSFVVPHVSTSGQLEASNAGAQEIQRWQFRSFHAGSGFAAAVAAERGSMTLQLFHL